MQFWRVFRGDGAMEYWVNEVTETPQHPNTFLPLFPKHSNAHASKSFVLLRACA